MKVIRLLVALLFLGTAAHASVIVYWATLNAANESPPNASPGVGNGLVTIDTVANTMVIHLVFSGLTTGNTAAHIHCCTAVPFAGTAGVATITPTFTGLPMGTTAENYDHLFDLTSATAYNPAFVTAQGGLANAEATLLAGLAAGTTYLNVHTTQNGGGEIRGFLVPVPEPGSFILTGLVLAALGIRRRK